MYILFGLALTLCLPASVLQGSKAPHIDLGRHLLAEPGRALLQLVSLLALLTTLNAGLMSASRLLYGLARERALGARLSSRLIALNEGGVPWAAVLTLAGLSLVAALIVILTDGASQMAQIGAGLYTLVYCAFAASHIRLRRMQGGALPPFRARIPLGVYVALVVISAGVGVATLLSALEQNLAGQCLLIAWTVAAVWLAHRVAQERSRRAQVA